MVGHKVMSVLVKKVVFVANNNESIQYKQPSLSLEVPKINARIDTYIK